MQPKNNFIPASELIINGDGSIYHLHLKPENLASLIFIVGELLGYRMLSLNAIVVNRPSKQMDKEAGKTVDRLIQTALAAFCSEQR